MKRGERITLRCWLGIRDSLTACWYDRDWTFTDIFPLYFIRSAAAAEGECIYILKLWWWRWFWHIWKDVNHAFAFDNSKIASLSFRNTYMKIHKFCMHVEGHAARTVVIITHRERESVERSFIFIWKGNPSSGDEGPSTSSSKAIVRSLWLGIYMWSKEQKHRYNSSGYSVWCLLQKVERWAKGEKCVIIEFH